MTMKHVRLWKINITENNILETATQYIAFIFHVLLEILSKTTLWKPRTTYHAYKRVVDYGKEYLNVSANYCNAADILARRMA